MLRGCPVGRLTMDPDVIADDALRAPLDATLEWLRERIAALLQEGLDNGEFAPGTVPGPVAATIVATVQGGYVLARASGSSAAFDSAVDGLLSLLATPARPA